MTITIELRRNRIRDVVVHLENQSREDVDTTAQSIRSLASQLAPVDTGALRSSLYVSNGTESDYSQCAAQARGLNPQATIVSEVRPEFILSTGGPMPDDAYIAVVGSAVNYAIFQEYGTRFMSPQSFLLPAIEGVAEAFISRMHRIADE